MANQLAALPSSRGVRIRGADAIGAQALLEFQSPSAELIARPVPWTSRVVIWAIFLMLILMISIAGLVPIDRVVTAAGRVVSVANTIVVQPLETSIVRSINVKEGDAVHKGDLLATLDPTFAASDVTDYRAQAVSLRSELARLRAEANGSQYVPDGSPASEVQAAIFASRASEKSNQLENYRQKIASLQAIAARAVGDAQAYTQRLGVAKIVESKRRELERLQVGSQLNTLSALDSRLEIDRGLEGAQATIQSATADLQAMIKERDGYVQTHAFQISQQITEQDRKLSDAEGQLGKADLRQKLVDLRADSDGVVLSIARVSVGSVMQSGDQFITMVPMDAPLEVEVDIAGRDSGFAHAGDPVTIKFDTFSYALYGYAKGTVRSVSADSFQNPMEDRRKAFKPNVDDDESPLGPVYYRGRVTLDEIKLHNLPKSFRMTPGMTATADIKVGTRTVLGFLLGRFIPATSEGMREP